MERFRCNNSANEKERFNEDGLGTYTSDEQVRWFNDSNDDVVVYIMIPPNAKHMPEKSYSTVA